MENEEYSDYEPAKKKIKFISEVNCDDIDRQL